MVSRTTRLGAQPAAKSPISSHPAFSAIVASWFALLLGIGSLIVPVVLFERIFANTGLTGILPATQAPLGVTARIIIALTAAAIGIAIGLLLARKVATAQAADKSVVKSDTRANHRASRVPQAQKPISALEELGSESLDHPFDDEPSDNPVPDHEDGLVDQPAVDAIDAEDGGEGEVEQPDEIITLEETSSAADFAEPAIAETDNCGPVEHAFAPAEVQPELESVGSPEEIASLLHSGITADQLISRPLEELGIVQLVERFAVSLQKHPAPVTGVQDLPELPDALRPVEYGDTWDDTHDDDDGDEDAGLSEIDWKVAFANSTQYAAEQHLSEAEIDPEVESDEDDARDPRSDEEYSSLLRLNKAIPTPRKSFALSEDTGNQAPEHGADFPHQDGESGLNEYHGPIAVPDAEARIELATGSEDAERALRDALQKLQKISGVG